MSIGTDGLVQPPRPRPRNRAWQLELREPTDALSPSMLMIPIPTKSGVKFSVRRENGESTTKR